MMVSSTHEKMLKRREECNTYLTLLKSREPGEKIKYIELPFFLIFHLSSFFFYINHLDMKANSKEKERYNE